MSVLYMCVCMCKYCVCVHECTSVMCMQYRCVCVVMVVEGTHTVSGHVLVYMALHIVLHFR